MKFIACLAVVVALGGCTNRCSTNRIIETKWAWNDYWNQPLNYLDNRCVPDKQED